MSMAGGIPERWGGCRVAPGRSGGRGPRARPHVPHHQQHPRQQLTIPHVPCWGAQCQANCCACECAEQARLPQARALELSLQLPSPAAALLPFSAPLVLTSFPRPEPQSSQQAPSPVSPPL